MWKILYRLRWGPNKDHLMPAYIEMPYQHRLGLPIARAKSLLPILQVIADRNPWSEHLGSLGALIRNKSTTSSLTALSCLADS